MFTQVIDFSYVLFQLKKLQDKAEKCRRDVENTRDKYEASLNDINSYNAKYMEDMSEVGKHAHKYILYFNMFCT